MFWRNMRRRKLRYFLTISGMAIGTLALVVMGSMAERVNQTVAGANEFLSRRVIVTPQGGNPFVGTISSKVIQDAAKVQGVAAVEGTVPILYDEAEKSVFDTPTIVEGISLPDHLKAMSLSLDRPLTFASGGWWTNDEKNVAVLGSDVAGQLKLHVGDPLKFRGKTFRVVGVLGRLLTGPDNGIFIPIEDARAVLAKTAPKGSAATDSKSFGMVYVIPEKGVNPDDLSDRLGRQLPGTWVVSPSKMGKKLYGYSLMLNALMLGSSLVAAGVAALSVVNTMITAINERTKEIGLKKALGASNDGILLEYLVEAGLIGLLGGLIGLGLGSGIALAANRVMANGGMTIFQLTPRLAVASVLFALILAVVAGLLPAWHAARIDPIRALRTAG